MKQQKKIRGGGGQEKEEGERKREPLLWLQDNSRFFSFRYYVPRILRVCLDGFSHTGDCYEFYREVLCL